MEEYTIKTQNICIDNNSVKLLKTDCIIPWNKITYTVEQKHYPTRKTYRGQVTAYGLKKVYKFYNGEKFLFYMDSYLDNKDVLTFIIDKLINTEIVKEKKCYIDGQECIELKYNKNTTFDFVVILLFYIAIFVAITLFYSLDKNINIGVWGLLLVLLILITILCFRKNINQRKQKIYLIKGKGIQIQKNGENTFYKFNEFDECIEESYWVTETVPHTLRFNKDKKEILEITNANDGFYEFFDEVKKEIRIK